MYRQAWDKNQKKRINKINYFIQLIDQKKDLIFLKYKKEIFSIDDGLNYIGRSRKDDIYLNIKSISRSHGCIFKKNNGLVYIDLMSRFGSKINNNPISFFNYKRDFKEFNQNLNCSPIFPGDILTLGEQKLVILHEEK